MNWQWPKVLFFVTISGCASISDYHFQQANERRAKVAWREVKGCLSEAEQNSDFADGFQAGYVDASRGGDGTPPPVPPNCYWGPRFQSHEGMERVNQWYCGFARGSNEARQKGLNHWNNVPSRVCCPN